MLKRLPWEHALLLACLATGAWWLGGYLSWLQRGCRAWLPFISDLQLYAPERQLTGWGMKISALLIAAGQLSLARDMSARLAAQHLHRLWSLLLLLAQGVALLAAACLMGLSEVPWNEDLRLHITLANGIFYGGFLWCAALTILSWRLQRGLGRSLLRSRLALSLLGGIGLVTMILSVQRFTDGEGGDWEQLIQRSQDMQAFCETSASPWLTRAAAGEWLLCLCMLGMLWTFRPEPAEEGPPPVET